MKKMKKKIQREPNLPGVTLYFPKEREILILEAEEGKENQYHKISVDLTFIPSRDEFKRGFSGLFYF